MLGPLGKRTLSALLLIISFQGKVETSYSVATPAPVLHANGDKLPFEELFLLLGQNNIEKLNITMATKIRLTCNLTVQAAQKSPTTGHWKKDGNEINKKEIESDQKAFSISHEFDFWNESDAGNYSCIFDTDPNSEGRFEVQIPPIWTKTERVALSKHNPVNLTCESGQYTPLRWIWRKGIQDGTQKLMNETDGYDIHSNGNKSILAIKNVMVDNSTYYHCEAVYTVGVSTLKIYLKVHDLTAALIPFLCIVAEVIVLVIVILACERRMKKKEEEPAEDKNPSSNHTMEELLESTGNGARHRKT
ncbi:embigin-like [Hypanus sabinus]|uniref:embigin-like n=1 Tax=Hypanus sabinus TaxID=79690 RepID=UPI0028C3FCF5|nr:embigin-like [Hypanus sabinus]